MPIWSYTNVNLCNVYIIMLNIIIVIIYDKNIAVSD
jgi:hypothetical protein